ncbi:MAG: hypothetical protein OXU66_05870 [Gammaproteobacteria bacterium]|nr:hypothetical protein [Gammaproteobacteria bacterium]
MKIEYTKLAELIGFVADFVSLLFVGYEIRQSNTIAKVTTEYEIRNNQSAANELIMTDPEFAALMAKWADPNSEPKGGEMMRAYAFILRQMNFWSAAATSYENGMLTDETYDWVKEDIQSTMSLPGIWLLTREVINLRSAVGNTSIMQLVTEELDSSGVPKETDLDLQAELLKN